MATQKPLVFNGVTGGFDEVTPKIVSEGATDAGKMFVTNEDGQWDASLLPVNDGAPVALASEDIPAGSFVNLYDDEGVAKLRLADASTFATRAHGYVKDDAETGNPVKFYESGALAGFESLTVGATYFLSDAAPGEAAAAAPTDTGHIAQVLAVATSATELQVDISEQPVVRA